MTDRIQSLTERLTTEADQCRNDGANDIAALLDEAAETLNSFDYPRGLTVDQEPKYTVNARSIVNRESGLPIPDDEPVFIFRARDLYARDAITHYLAEILQRNGSDKHADAVLARLRDFKRFADRNQRRMKHPDTEPAAVRALSRDEAAAVDAVLGLIELPPIRVSPEVYGHIELGARTEGLIPQAYVRELLVASLTGAAALIAVRSAVRAYHHALDLRRHGGVAMNDLVHAVEAALGTHWVQGATLLEGSD